MIERKCSTCKHFEAAPMWKKGWCRNPLLYSPQQSHLVGEDDLDCNRGMGSYWEALDSDDNEDEPVLRFSPPPPRTIAPAPPLNQQATSGQARRPPRAPVAQPVPRPRPSEPLATASPETYAAQEQQPWGDYLRRGFPAVLVILLLGAFWVLSARLLPQADTGTAPASETTAASGNGAAPLNIILPTPTAASAQPPASAPAPALAPGEIGPGARVVVSTGGNGANIRANPTTGGALVRPVADDTVLAITGPSQDADGYTWWPVEGEGFSGWIAGSLIEAAP